MPPQQPQELNHQMMIMIPTRAVDGAENEQNAIRIFGYFVLIFGYFRANLWLFCRPARSTTATATPHGQEIGFFLPRKIQK